MLEYAIILKPIYSSPAPEIPSNLKIPANWTLSWHQVETWKAINSSDIDVIFNIAMTGDGKSLAAYLPTLQGNFNIMGLYPTNELARDQFSQIAGYIKVFQPTYKLRINLVTGPELEIYAENEGLTKAAAIATRGSQSEILLSNPDIFHYLHRGAYLITHDNPDKLWNRIDKNFDLFLLDEFHVFSAPQIASILNTMLLIKNTNRRKKFLFLSATPNQQLLNQLELAGFRYKCIDPAREEKYQFADTPEEGQKLVTQGWRQIAREIKLNFIPLESSPQASENWLKENQDLILKHFQQSPNSKGAIILNSIAAVKRLVPIFRELFSNHGLTVGENTGLSGSEAKLKSLECDLVLGTSTIDVGVDFKINFLIFESSDVGNFIQRLGRLGRHKGYKNLKFDSWQAYALVPMFLVERLFKTENPPLTAGEKYDRIYLNQTIREKYRKINSFEGYYRRWGAIQSFKLWWDLGHKELKQAYPESCEQFQQDCENVFDVTLKSVTGRVYSWAKEWQNLSGTKGNPILEDASSFRGSSGLLCGLWDLTENPLDSFKTYDLPGILGNLDIEMWTEAAFRRKLEETAKLSGQLIAKGRFKHCMGFMKLRGYRDQRLNWRFHYLGNLQAKAEAWKVQILLGLQVWQPENLWIKEINNRLLKHSLVCYILPRNVNDVRYRLQLPMHFPIYPISDETSIHEIIPPYSIALSQGALLLDTLAYRFKDKGGENWIC